MTQKVLSSIWICLRKGKLNGVQLSAVDVREDTNIEKLLFVRIGILKHYVPPLTTKKN